MSMRAPASDLPFMFVDARIVAGEVTILDRVTLDDRRRARRRS